MIEKLKMWCRGHMLLMIGMAKKNLERFTMPKKQIKKSLELKR